MESYPISQAVSEGGYQVIKYLLETYDVNIEETSTGHGVFDDELVTPLHIAVSRGFLDVVKLLLFHGAQVNTATAVYKTTPLYIACLNNWLDVVKCLLDHGANIDDANCYGTTSLMIACNIGSFSLVSHLLSAKPDMHRKSLLTGNTALHECCTSKSPECDDIFLALLKHGASIHAKNVYGVTPPVQAALEDRLGLLASFDTRAFLSCEQQIESLEVFGACITLWDYQVRAGDFYWSVALKQRHIHQLRKKEMNSSIYLPGEREFSDNKTLREVSQSREVMLHQAILLLERILGPAHPFVTRSLALATRSTMDLRLRVLEIQQQQLQPLDPNIKTTFKNLMYDTDSDLPALQRYYIIFSKAVDQLAMGKMYLEEHSNSTNAHILLNELTALLDMIFGFLATFDEHLFICDVKINAVWRKLVQIDLRVAFGYTPLHFTCSTLLSTANGGQPNASVGASLSRRLVYAGANPNARDNAGNTPLHLSAMMPDHSQLIPILVDAGADFSVRNENGEAFKDLADVLNCSYLKRVCSFKDATKLTCLASSVIKSDKIPFEDLLPRSVAEFVLND